VTLPPLFTDASKPDIVLAMARVMFDLLLACNL
jgi:hypothetical protein